MKNKTVRIIILVGCIILNLLIIVVTASKDSPLNMYKGLLSQVRLALCVAMVTTMPKTGYIVAIAINIFLFIDKLYRFLTVSQESYVSLFIYIISIILLSIIYFYSKTTLAQQQELRKQYDEILDTKRILQEKDEALRNFAYKDQLTGMYNAHYMHLKMNEAIQAELPFHVIYLDIDNFKQIDDTLGPKAGDLAIINYAERIQSLSSDNCICVRMNSDKFAIFLKEKHTEAEIIQLIERLRSVINSPITVKMQNFNLSASYGVISFPQDGGSTEMLLKHAIMAVYNVKSNGKNQLCFFSRG